MDRKSAATAATATLRVDCHLGESDGRSSTLKQQQDAIGVVAPLARFLTGAAIAWPDDACRRQSGFVIVGRICRSRSLGLSAWMY